MPELYQVTHSLLTSWLYCIKENPYEDATTERDPMAEFMKVLRREPTPTTEAMQKGIEFEDLVMNIVRGVGDPAHPWYNAASKAADIVRGGVFQYSAAKVIQAGGLDVKLTGRLDALRAGIIYDIKFSGSYDRGKFYGSTQHPTYFELIPESDLFTYLVSNGRELWTEKYYREDTKSIVPTISNFFEWLGYTGLLGLYKEKWVVR